MLEQNTFDKLLNAKDNLMSLSSDCNLPREPLVKALDIVDDLLKQASNWPVLDGQGNFRYKGYDCELLHCYGPKDCKNNDSDKYVCFIYGHRNEDGDRWDGSDPDWLPKQYLVPGAWLYGAGYDVVKGKPVNSWILKRIDQFIEGHNNDF